MEIQPAPGERLETVDQFEHDPVRADIEDRAMAAESASSSSRTTVGAVSSAATTSHSSGPSQRTLRSFHALTAFSPGAANGNSSGRRTSICASRSAG